MNIRQINKLALLCVLSAATGAHAASNGSLGATSQGSSTISVTKAVQAQISDISDMTLSGWSIGDGAVTLTSNVCIYSTTGSYTVRATGSGAGNIFTINSGSNLLAYSVTWNDGGATHLANTGTLLAPGVTSTNFSNASTTSALCNGGGASNDTARVIVGITSVAMDAAASSATPYTGTLTMLVTPF